MLLGDELDHAVLVDLVGVGIQLPSLQSILVSFTSLVLLGQTAGLSSQRLDLFLVDAQL